MKVFYYFFLNLQYNFTPLHIFKHLNGVLFPKSVDLVKREHTSCFLTISGGLFISHLLRIALGCTDGAE